MTRVAVVDIGTNSTRLLLADVDDAGLTVLDRRSTVTRLGEGLEASGELGEVPRGRVLAALDDYRAAIESADVRTAVLTSAVRDARNGVAFMETVRSGYGLDANTISGDEEARLTFLGATSNGVSGAVLVVDIGGGSTEMVAGTADGVEHHVSTQVGVVRHSERHLVNDPPTAAELAALREDAGATIRAALPDAPPEKVVAVAGTATMAAAMDLGLEPFDADRVEGHTLTLDALRARLDALAAVPLAERVKTPGLHPDRAPTIVAGVAILIEILAAAGATTVTVSDRDILYGRAIEAGAEGN